MIITLITFFIILGLLVFVHELGHCVAAKKGGVKVEEFGFGFPPRIIGVYKDSESKRWKIIGRKIKEASQTIYSINWIPLGGFVRIKGEEGDKAEDVDSFTHQKIGKRIWIISAGVLMNVLLAFVLISFGFVVGLPQVLDETIPPSAKIRNEKIQIADVAVGLPAQKQDIRLGDVIISIDNIVFSKPEDIQVYLNSKIGQIVSFKLGRGKEIVEKEVTPELLEKVNRGGIGVSLAKTGVVSLPILTSIREGAKTTFLLTKEIILAFYFLIKDLLVTQEVSIELSGPVGIAVITGQVAQLGFIYILQFTALLSLNLAIINFIPFPALDGGRVLFLILEKIRGKPINQRVEATIHNIGFILLMLLVLTVTYRDIFKFSDKFVGLWGAITGLF